MDRSKYWTIPCLWPDSTVYVLGGGPSIKKLSKEYLEALSDKRVVACNNSWELTDCEILYFGDVKWWYPHWGNRGKAVKNHKGLILTSANETIGLGPRVKHLKRGKPFGIEENPEAISWNHNTGLSAINIAYHFGARRIVLLGFDMRMIDGEKNYHKDHKEETFKKSEYFGRFKVHMRGCPSIKKDAERLGVKIYNATPESAIKDFPIITPEEGLDV